MKHVFTFKHSSNDPYSNKKESELCVIFNDDMETEKLFDFFAHFLSDLGHPAAPKMVEEISKKSKA